MRLGERTIWSGASASIAEGEFVVALGPNGAGKSSLLRLLLGLVAPGAGRVEVFGERPRRGNPQIGYVPQRRAADAGLGIRGRDLVALGIDGHHWGVGLPGARRQHERAQVDDVIAAVGASAYANRAIGQLSGGERQRLLLAQALVGEPRLLLLDEPLASLDVRSQIATSQLIARLARARGMTVVLVAHDVNPLLPALDRVLYIAHGTVAIGAPEDIITSERLSSLYDAPIEVVRDRRGRVFVVGLDDDMMAPHAAHER
jgi:zinc/manganese transport system ATP-binding protein